MQKPEVQELTDQQKEALLAAEDKPLEEVHPEDYVIVPGTTSLVKARTQDIVRMAIQKAVAKKVLQKAENKAITTGAQLLEKAAVKGTVKAANDFARMRPEERGGLASILQDLVKKGR